MEDFIIKEVPEYIYFLQHPEKKDHYLIIQEAEIVMVKFLHQFNRTGIYENGPATLPHNKVTLIEKIPVPDKNLFGLYYFICNELEEITYKEDERIPYGEWGWYVVNGSLQTSKWLKDYLESQNAKQKNKSIQNLKPTQITLF